MFKLDEPEPSRHVVGAVHDAHAPRAVLAEQCRYFLFRRCRGEVGDVERVLRPRRFAFFSRRQCIAPAESQKESIVFVSNATEVEKIVGRVGDEWRNGKIARKQQNR